MASYQQMINITKGKIAEIEAVINSGDPDITLDDIKSLKNLRNTFIHDLRLLEIRYKNCNRFLDRYIFMENVIESLPDNIPDATKVAIASSQWDQKCNFERYTVL